MSISLNQVRIAEPCTVSWDGMTGDEQKRFCEQCGKYVHDLAAMPTAAAERLVCDSAGGLCLRITLNRKGEVVTLNYDPAKRRGWPWKVWAGVGVVGAILAGVVNAVWMGNRGGRTSVVMGAMVCRVPTTAPTTAPKGVMSVDEDSAADSDGPASRPSSVGDELTFHRK